MKPITASMLRAPTSKRLASHPALRGLARRLEDAFASEIRSFGAMPVKASLEDIAEGSLVPARGEVPLFVLSSGDKQLEAMIAGDRSLAFALTDLAMGGTGTETAFNPEDRPLSRFEEDVRELFLARLMRATIPWIAEAIFVNREQAPDLLAKPDAEPTARTSVILRFLLNIGAYAGELRLAFESGLLRGALESASRPVDTAAAPPGALLARVRESSSELTVSLPEEWLPLAALSSARPGQTVMLQSRIGTPVEVRAGGKLLFTGGLARSGNRLAVLISG